MFTVLIIYTIIVSMKSSRECIADIPALEESDVEDGGVEVYELEEEHLEGEAVLIFRVCPGSLCYNHIKVSKC